MRGNAEGFYNCFQRLCRECEPLLLEGPRPQLPGAKVKLLRREVRSGGGERSCAASHQSDGVAP
jgi:hypothetical protein